MVLLILLNLLALVKCNEDKIVDFISNIISYSFESYKTLFYISDGSSFSYYIHKSLQKDQTMIVVPPYDNILNYKPGIFRAVGAIIITANITFLNSLLGQKTYKDFKFFPHYRILIFFQGSNTEFKKYPFDYAQQIEGLDLLVVEVDVTQNFKSQSAYFIKLMYLNSDKVLLTWNGEGDIQIKMEDLNMLGWQPRREYIFNVAAFNCPPYVYTDEHNAFDGIEFRIIKHIMKRYNIEYQIFSENLQENRSKSLYSLVKESVYNKTSDIAICSHWMVSLGKYFNDYDMTIPYAQACITFLVPKPQPKSDSSFVFQPLKPATWALMLSTTFLSALILYILGKYYLNIRNEINSYIDPIGNYLVIIRIFTLSGLHAFPKPPLRAIRIFVTCWALNVLLLATAYAAGFASALTSVQFSDPINTLQDMVNQNIYWGGPDTNTKNMFMEGNAVHRKLGRNYVIEPNNQYRDMRVTTNKYALLIKKLSQYYLTDTETLDNYAKTHMKIINECVGEFGIILVLKKASPFTKIFNEQISRLLEHGFINYWYTKMMTNYNQDYMYNFFTSQVESSNLRPLKVSHLLGNFYLLFAGQGIAAIIFLLEHFFRSIKAQLQPRIYMR